MANTNYYIDPSAAINGTGTQISPFNTIAGLPTEQSKNYLLKTGTSINEDLGALLNGDNNLIGSYGTGAKPIIDRSASLTGMVYNGTYDIWSKSLGTTQFGHVWEDEIPLKAIYWNGTNTIGVIGPTMTAGSFAFDPVAQVVYVKPSSGLISDHTYRYANGLYCIRTQNANKNVTIIDIDTTGASRHGIQLYSKLGLRIENVGGGRHGGYWEEAITAYLGNGIEVSSGCLGVEIVDCEQNDIWDSAFTTQLYEATAATARSHEYRNIKTKRFGLAGIEVSNPGTDSNQVIKDIYVVGANIEDGGVGLWMNKPGGYASSAVSTLSNGLTNSIDGVVFSGVVSKNVGRLWTTSNTQGKCAMMDSTGDGMNQYGLRKVYAGGGLATSTDVVKNVVLTNSAANSEAGGAFTFQNYFRQVRTFL